MRSLLTTRSSRRIYIQHHIRPPILSSSQAFEMGKRAVVVLIGIWLGIDGDYETIKLCDSLDLFFTCVRLTSMNEGAVHSRNQLG